MSEDRLQSMFEEFVTTSQEKPIVAQVYEAQPYMSSEQQRVFLRMRATAQRWSLVSVHAALDEFLVFQRSNRPIGMQFNKMLQSVSLYQFTKEMMKPPAQVGGAVGGRR